MTTDEEDPTGPEIRKGSSSLLANFLKLSSGTAFAQFLGILAAPAITRLYAPEAFGLAAIFASFIAILAPVGSLRLELAVMLPREDRQAADLLAMCVLLVLAATAVLVAAIAGFGEELLSLLQAEELHNYRWFLPAGFLAVALQFPLGAWCSRNRRFSQVAAAHVSDTVVGTGATLGGGLLGLVSGGHLILARLAGQVGTALLLLAFIVRHDLSFLRIHVTLAGMRRGLIRYRRFPFYSTWITLLNGSSRFLPPILLAAYFGPATAGLFALARRVILIPSLLVSASMSQILFQRASEMHTEQRPLSELFTEAIRRLIALGLFPMLMLAIAGPELFRLAFGDRWTEAGAYAGALAPWIFTSFVSGPVASLFNVLERQRLGLIMNAAVTAVRIATLVYGGLILGEALPALHLYAAAGVVFNLSYVGILGTLVRVRWAKVFRSTALAGAAAVTAGSLPVWASRVWGISDATMLAACVCAAIIYLGLVSAFDRSLRETASGALRRYQSRRRD